MRSNILSTGELVDHGSDEKRSYEIIVLDESYKDEIISIQNQVVAEMADNSNYEPLTPEEFDGVFAGEGYGLGVLVSDHLAGFRIVTYGDEETYQMARSLELPPEKVVFFESTVILKRYQGNRLQWVMTKDALDYIIERHTFDYGVSTVSPTNVPSLKNLMKAGFVTVALKPLYDGAYRFVCLKSFEEEKKNFSESLEIPLSEVVKLQKNHENGYVGTRLVMRDDELNLIQER